MEIPIVYEVSSTKKPNPEPESTTSPTDMVHFEFPTPTPRYVVTYRDGRNDDG